MIGFAVRAPQPRPADQFISTCMNWKPEPSDVHRCWADTTKPPCSSETGLDCGQKATTDVGLCARCYAALLGREPQPQDA